MIVCREQKRRDQAANRKRQFAVAAADKLAAKERAIEEAIAAEERAKELRRIYRRVRGVQLWTGLTTAVVPSLQMFSDMAKVAIRDRISAWFGDRLKVQHEIALKEQLEAQQSRAVSLIQRNVAMWAHRRRWAARRTACLALYQFMTLSKHLSNFRTAVHPTPNALHLSCRCGFVSL